MTNSYIGHDFLNRHQWKALPPKRLQPLDTPVGNVVTLWAETDFCSTTEECQQVLRELQIKHLADDMADIQSNFYIGGDGIIYEGRGWYNQCPEYPKYNKLAEELNGRCVQLAYIGRSGAKLGEKIMKGSNNLLNFGVLGKFLEKRVNVYFNTPRGLEYIDSFYTDSRSSILPGSSGNTEGGDEHNSGASDPEKLQ